MRGAAVGPAQTQDSVVVFDILQLYLKAKLTSSTKWQKFRHLGLYPGSLPLRDPSRSLLWGTRDQPQLQPGTDAPSGGSPSSPLLHCPSTGALGSHQGSFLCLGFLCHFPFLVLQSHCPVSGNNFLWPLLSLKQFYFFAEAGSPGSTISLLWLRFGKDLIQKQKMP